MLHHHPPGMRGATPAVCLVAPTGPGLADMLRHAEDVALTLAGRGWRIHCLLCGDIDRAAQDRLQSGGVGCTWLDELRYPATLTLGGPHLFPALHDSDRVRFALQLLHEQQPFDLIEFPERGGLGFRTVQAKTAGQGFGDVVLATTLHGPGPALRHAYQQWLNRPEDLALDHAERYAFEHADVQWAAQPRAAQPSWLTEVRRLGWSVGEDAAEFPRDAGHLADAVAQAARLHAAAPGRRAACTTPETIPEPPLVTVSVAYFNLPRYLDETLASLARQTYPRLDVLVIDDGSTDPEAVRVFDELRPKYPRFRFVHQENQGIGATRNRGLAEAQGELFLPVDADNIADPDMVRRFVLGMQRRPELAALTCYFLAFHDSATTVGQVSNLPDGGACQPALSASKAPHLARVTEDHPSCRPGRLETCPTTVGHFAYAYKPTGGPRVLGCLHNVYGDGNAMFRVAPLRAVGGFATDRDTSFEDWEVFVKLVSAGCGVDVLPDFLFHYRHRDAGFSRVTNPYKNHQRVLRRYIEIADLPEQERAALWNLLAGCQHRLTELEDANRTLKTRLASRRYRIVDGVKKVLDKVAGTLRVP